MDSLQKLINASLSMSQEEKDGWLNLLPKMNDAQKKELENILATEKQKLEEIDARYKKELQGIEQEYITKYLSGAARKRWEETRKREEESLSQSAQEAEAVLKNL